MGLQRTFAGLAYSDKKKVTRRERFLAEMNTVMPWAELTALIAPHYPRPHAGAGRPAMPLERCSGSTVCSSGSICPIQPRKCALRQ